MAIKFVMDVTKKSVASAAEEGGKKLGGGAVDLFIWGVGKAKTKVVNRAYHIFSNEVDDLQKVYPTIRDFHLLEDCAKKNLIALIPEVRGRILDEYGKKGASQSPETKDFVELLKKENPTPDDYKKIVENAIIILSKEQGKMSGVLWRLHSEKELFSPTGYFVELYSQYCKNNGRTMNDTFHEMIFSGGRDVLDVIEKRHEKMLEDAFGKSVSSGPAMKH